MAYPAAAWEGATTVEAVWLGQVAALSQKPGAQRNLLQARTLRVLGVRRRHPLDAPPAFLEDGRPRVCHGRRPRNNQSTIGWHVRPVGQVGADDRAGEDRQAIIGRPGPSQLIQ